MKNILGYEYWHTEAETKWMPFRRRFFKCIFLNENVSIAIKISLKFVLKGPINNIPALVQIMTRRRPGDKPLSEPMMVSLPTHICVTRPQWVKASNFFDFCALREHTEWRFIYMIKLPPDSYFVALPRDHQTVICRVVNVIQPRWRVTRLWHKTDNGRYLVFDIEARRDEPEYIRRGNHIRDKSIKTQY